MKINIKRAHDIGIRDKERIVLNVLEDCNCGSFILFDTTYVDENQISNQVRHSFWLPDKDVQKGDLIVIYTKRRNDSEKVNADGSKTHFIYMGLDITIWNENGDAATLVEISDWNFKKIRNA